MAFNSIECIDVALSERRVDQWIKMFVLNSAFAYKYKYLIKTSRMNDSDKQTKLCL